MVISRREAAALGYKRFFTGKPCKYGHTSERYTSSGNCVDCVNIKIQQPPLPAPVEKYKFADGREVFLISREEAHRRDWPVFFTGQPCDVGHMSERNVKSGRCLACMHPVKYGRDAHGWVAFQPKPPLRVPIAVSPNHYNLLAEKIQATIPAIIEELKLAPPELDYETDLILGVWHRHYHADNQIWNGMKLWWCITAGARENIPENLDPRCVDLKISWVKKQNKWYGVLPGGELVPVIMEKYVPEDR